MFTEPVIKHLPEDFVVSEQVVVKLCDKSQANYIYFLLRKRNYTTMEAIRLLASEYKIATEKISYCGLKDEDAITEQLVCLPVDVQEGENCHQKIIGDTQRWLEIKHYGYGKEQLKIGGLLCNGFRIVTRNLDEDISKKIDNFRKFNLLFINYYDYQRFGVPGGPKHTHLLGACLLEKKWDQALQHLINLKAPESDIAKNWKGSAYNFFQHLDPRNVAFYLSSNASRLWNQKLINLVKKSCDKNSYDINIYGLEYTYSHSVADTIRLMANRSSLPYTRFEFKNADMQSRQSIRPTVIQSTIVSGSRESDEEFPGRYKVVLNFCLPSGCYATAAIRQFLNYIS